LRWVPHIRPTQLGGLSAALQSTPCPERSISLFRTSLSSSSRAIQPVPENDFCSPRALPSLSLWKANVSWPCALPAFVSSPASVLLRASEKQPSAALRRPDYERRAFSFARRSAPH